MAVLAAAAIVAAVLLGIRQSHTQQQLDQAQARSRALAAVLAAPDARLATAPVNTGGVLTVVASPRRHEAVVTTAGLPALTGSKVYQLWFVAGTSARSAGLLPRPVDGRTAPVLATGLVRGDVVALTVEPAGGTRKPTTSPIVAVPVR
jgi:anti-sigma-K factor RskA